MILVYVGMVEENKKDSIINKLFIFSVTFYLFYSSILVYMISF